MRMPPRWPVPVALWVVLAIVLVAGGGLAYLRHHRYDADVLPPAVVQAIDAEKAARPSLDSAIAAERYAADMARAERAGAEARAAQLQRVAAAQGRRADSLALEARHAVSASDSALMWHLAYAARTTERDTLLVTIDTLRHAVTLAEAEARAEARGRELADAGRHRADSVLDATVAAARSADCRVPGTFGLVHCMSRTKAALVGVVAGVGGTVLVNAARDGRLSLSVPFLR